MEFLLDLGLFLAKTVTIVVAIVVVIGVIVSAGLKNKHQQQSGQIQVSSLSDELDDLEDDVRQETMSKDEYKQYHKAKKEQDKKQQKARKKQLKKSDDESSSTEKSRLFVIDFDGDIQASSVENLREEVTAVLSVANEKDEVLIRLESAGGMVHSYGLAASQLERVRRNGLKLHVAVDKVAASGGYMMACIGEHIMAAPFAIIGSIGVLGQLPNFSRLLKHNKIDYEQHTAGEFKRTLTMFGENNDKAREKFREELEQTHVLFKEFIQQNRADLDIDKVATGEHWYGTQAKALNLVDEIKTSDDFVVERAKQGDVFKVKYEIKKPLSERLPLAIFGSLQNSLLSFLQKADTHKMFK